MIHPVGGGIRVGILLQSPEGMKQEWKWKWILYERSIKKQTLFHRIPIHVKTQNKSCSRVLGEIIQISKQHHCIRTYGSMVKIGKRCRLFNKKQPPPQLTHDWQSTESTIKKRVEQSMTSFLVIFLVLVSGLEHTTLLRVNRDTRRGERNHTPKSA